MSAGLAWRAGTALWANAHTKILDGGKAQMDTDSALAVASLAVWIACSAVWSAPGLTLAVAGGTEYAIVVAEDAAAPERTGRPAGSTGFVAALEALTGRLLRRQKPGPTESRVSKESTSG